MTPFEIGILLHYYAHVGESPDVTRKPPIMDETMLGFVEAGLLEPLDVPDECGATYHATEATRVYVEALMAVPRPVQRWVIP